MTQKKGRGVESGIQIGKCFCLRQLRVIRFEEWELKNWVRHQRWSDIQGGEVLSKPTQQNSCYLWEVQPRWGWVAAQRAQRLEEPNEGQEGTFASGITWRSCPVSIPIISPNKVPFHIYTSHLPQSPGFLPARGKERTQEGSDSIWPNVAGRWHEMVLKSFKNLLASEMWNRSKAHIYFFTAEMLSTLGLGPRSKPGTGNLI